ncbi:MAG: zinc ribbon domain-containing protein [Acidobacteria bacterium]|nr:zinc ribbon domain-containing protein [Acidobacteriota bacterium]
MAVREGAWDCPVCGRTGIRGSQKYCGGCGHPRGNDVRFYLPEDAPEVTAAEELARAQAGPDWICAYCGADNPGTDGFCSGCGAPPDDGRRREVREIRPDQPADAPPPVMPAAASSRRSKGWWIGCAGLLALILLVAVILFLVFRPRSAELKVEGHGWQRTMSVEAFRTLAETGWQGEIPADARILARSRQVRSHRQVQVGTERREKVVTERRQAGTRKVKVGVKDLGNGYFEDIYEDQPVYEDVQKTVTVEEPVYREEPVYAIQIRYEVDRWIKIPDKTAGGRGRQAQWPSLADNERAVQRKAAYTVFFRDADGDTYEYPVPDEATWLSFREGERYVAAVIKPTKKVKAIEKKIGR